MTQHYLRPNTSHADHVIIVGWDRPMNTFFAHVVRRTDSGPEQVLWEGRNRDECHNSTDLVSLVKDYVDTDCVLLAEVATTLFCDQQESETATVAEANAVRHWGFPRPAPATGEAGQQLSPSNDAS